MRKQIKDLSRDLERITNDRLARVQFSCEVEGEEEFAVILKKIRKGISEFRRLVKQKSKICLK